MPVKTAAPALSSGFRNRAGRTQPTAGSNDSYESVWCLAKLIAASAPSPLQIFTQSLPYLYTIMFRVSYYLFIDSEQKQAGGMR